MFLHSIWVLRFKQVSKWENGMTMPDVARIPSLASFFDVTTDELFDFDLLRIEEKVMEICHDAAKKADALIKAIDAFSEDVEPLNGTRLCEQDYIQDYRSRAQRIIAGSN